MNPTKEEFQQLIELCKVNRFTMPHMDIEDIAGMDRDDLDDYIKDSIILLMNSRKQAFKSEYTKLPAYVWMSTGNKTHYDLVIDYLFQDDYDSEPYIKEAETFHRRNFKKKGYLENIFARLGRNLINISYRVQRKERFLGHLATCFMEFLYPSKELCPADFKDELNDAIIALEKSKKCYQKLEKYKGIMYGYSPFNDLEHMNSKLATLKKLEDNYIFPTKKTNKQYPVRIFIMYFLSYFISGNTSLKDNEVVRDDFNEFFEFKDVHEVINPILSFICFDSFHIPNDSNVRKIINDELDRRHLCLTLKHDTAVSRMIGQQVLVYSKDELVDVIENYNGEKLY